MLETLMMMMSFLACFIEVFATPGSCNCAGLTFNRRRLLRSRCPMTGCRCRCNIIRHCHKMQHSTLHHVTKKHFKQELMIVVSCSHSSSSPPTKAFSLSSSSLKKRAARDKHASCGRQLHNKSHVTSSSSFGSGALHPQSKIGDSVPKISQKLLSSEEPPIHDLRGRELRWSATRQQSRVTKTQASASSSRLNLTATAPRMLRSNTVTCGTSHVTRHTSHVTRHTSHVTGAKRPYLQRRACCTLPSRPGADAP